MSSFNGVSVVTDGWRCATSAVDAGMGNVYHLLVVKDYWRTIQEVPNGRAISSGPFLAGGHRWRFSYFPNGANPSCADYFSLFIGLLYEDPEEAVEAKFQFSFVDESEYQNPIHIRATKTRSFCHKTRGWGGNKFMKRDALERSVYLKDDCFTVRCDIMVCNDLNASTDDADGTMSHIHDHLHILLQNKTGADVTFDVRGEMFVAHRCVLAARSKVFEAELFGPMAAEGTTSGAVQIKDMEAKVFAALLRFIYTGAFPEMDIDNDMEEDKAQVVQQGQEVASVEYLTWVQDLFVAAHRYDLRRLKFICEKQLSEIICVSSVGSILALAERHHCYRLKESCFKFIQVQSPNFLNTVMATDGWKHVTMTYPSILNEIVVKLASNQKKKKRKLQRM